MKTVFEEVPQVGDIELTIQIKARFNYSAIASARIVRRFVADEIGYLLRVGEPALVAQKRFVWRIPITLGDPNVGEIGPVGTIDVDVEDGRILVTPAQIEHLRQSALALATQGKQDAARTSSTPTELG